MTRGTPLAELGLEELGPAVERLRRRAPQLARRAVDRYVAETPLYGPENIPPHVRRQTVHNTRLVLDLCLRAVLDPECIAGAPAPWHDDGVDRSHEGLPVREYLRAWHISYDVLTEELHEALADFPDGLRFALARTRRAHDHLLREGVTAFEAHARSLVRETQDAAALAALFQGADWPGAHGLVPENPVVVAARFGPSGAEETSDHTARTAAQHRKIRYLRAHLARALPGLELADIRADSAHLLIDGEPADARALAAGLGESAGTEVLLAVEPADGVADLPRAHRLATEVLAVGAGAGLTGTAIRLADVALQLQLSEPGPALDLIRRRCEPVLGRPDLVTTVREFLRCDLDRRSAAAALVVHPNTIDNRLARVRELTGLDVHVTADLLTLAIAVAPERAERIPPPATRL